MTDDRQWYEHALRCRSCSHRFTVQRLTADPNKVRPSCPRCKGKTKQSFQPDVGMDVSAGKAPGVIGANVQNVAYDRAMEGVMREQQLGDIQDHSRPGSVYRAGESTAPKLPAHLQKQSENFWGNSQPNKPRTRTAKVDLSAVLGPSPGGQSQPAGQKFTADAPSAIAPILNARPAGSSPIPPHTVIAG